MMKVFFGVCVLSAAVANGQTLSLDQYMGQVKGQDPGWKAAASAVEGSRLLQTEADSITGVQLTSQVSYLNDKRLTSNPTFQGDQTEYSGYLIGFKQQTSWGAQWSLTQNLTHTRIFNASPATVPVPNYYDSYPKLDLSFSLWRNFLGAEVSSQIDQSRQLAMGRSKQAELLTIQKEIEVEAAFYSVVALQQSVEAQRDGVARATRVLEWTRSRIARNLADASDIYQAQAAVAARRIELVSVESNLARAIQKLNSLRGIQSAELKEALVPTSIDLAKLKLAKSEAKIRKDVRLRQFEIAGAAAAYKASREKFKPQLDLSLSALKQGRGPSQSAADEKAYGSDGKDYLQVALTLNVPLDQFRESDHRAGYDLLSRSQALKDQARTVDERLTWDNNVVLAEQLRDQVQSAWELEGLQKNKANAEREKFNRGRSTLFQVLTYEQDYLTARSLRINLEFEIRQFVAQLDLFE